MANLRATLASATFIALSLSSAATANQAFLDTYQAASSDQTGLIMAQVKPQVNPQVNPQAQKKFVNNFVNGVFTGCTKSAKSADVKDQRKYCQCYAGSFANRYTPDQLAAINKGASLSPEAPTLINIMMSPESSSCRKQ